MAGRKSVVPSLLVTTLEYVASNAGSYSGRLLAALPRRLRINLLRLMRIVDLCGAEAKDGVCADFNVTDCVWRFVGEREILLEEPMDISIPLRDLEDMFHSVGDRRLSWSDGEWVLEQFKMVGEFSRDRYLNAIASCLLSSQEMLRNAAIFALFTSNLSRDDVAGRAFARMFSEEYLLVILLHECRFQPSAVYIDCTDMIRSGLWTRRKTSFHVVRRALRGVKQLTVSLTGPSRTTSRITIHNRVDILLLFRFVLEAVFVQDYYNDTLRITHVTIKGDIESLASAVGDHLCQFLAPQDFSLLPTFAESLLTSGYDGIEYLSFELNARGLGSNARASNRFHRNLMRIIDHQKCLRNLCLVGWCTGVPINARTQYSSFIEGVAKLFRIPTFRSLLLEMNMYRNGDGYERNLSCILREFLSSPVAGQALKAYCVNGNFPAPCSDFCRHQSEPSSAHVRRRRLLPVSSTTAPDKHLFVIDEDVRIWFDKFATRCLVNHSLYQNLSEVVLEGVEGISDDTLAALRPLRLKSLNISNPCTDLMASVSIEALVQAVGMPTLEELTLYDVVCGHLILHYDPNSPDKLAQALMRGLWKQAMLGKLVRLDLSRNCLGAVKFQYLRDLFQGLFAFRQLSRTTVFLHDNHFKNEHFQLMCLAWQMYAENRRLLQLGASSVRRDIQTYTECRKLDDIAYVIT